MHKQMNVNEAQSKAISHREGPMLVLAGPGSGKTLVITQRIKYLIEEYHVEPERILVITFTKAAAKEMQSRFVKLSEGNFYPVNFGTFHAIFFQILKQAYHFDASSIVRESEKRKYLEEILRKISINKKETEEQQNAEKISLLLSEISKVKSSGITLSAYESEVCDTEEFSLIYEEYRNALLSRRKVDFDDMVLLCLELLRERPQLLKAWQDRFSYILVDEFQDINSLQYEVIRLLALPENNLFIVGDDDQAIYGFRGSNPNIMLHFEEDYANAERVLLDVNYRSKSDIVEASCKLIKHNKNRFDKMVEAINPAKNGVRFFHFESRQQQTQNIIALIRQYMKKPGAHYHDIAVIYRTNMYASAMAEGLIRERIPFQMKEKITNIYDTSVAKDIVAYLKYAFNESDAESFYRIMNRPVRYIRRDSVPVKGLSKETLLQNNKEKQYVLQNIIYLFEQLHFIRNMSPFAAVNYIRKGMGYEEFLSKQHEENKKALTEDRKILDDLQERAKGFDTIPEWLTHITHYDENMVEAKNREDDAVHIVTMHASKGLEWPVVILPDCNEGVVPHKKAKTQEEIEEERRMFFVAMTRAKENLFLFYVQETDKKKTGDILPSRFIKECT